MSIDSKVETYLDKIGLPRGLVVRIRRFHRRGPGSIPGVGKSSFFSY